MHPLFLPCRGTLLHVSRRFHGADSARDSRALDAHQHRLSSSPQLATSLHGAHRNPDRRPHMDQHLFALVNATHQVVGPSDDAIRHACMQLVTITCVFGHEGVSSNALNSPGYASDSLKESEICTVASDCQSILGRIAALEVRATLEGIHGGPLFVYSLSRTTLSASKSNWSGAAIITATFAARSPAWFPRVR